MSSGVPKKSTLWQLPIESLSFGGWGDYQTWADHNFQPRPRPEVSEHDPDSTKDAAESLAAGDVAEPQNTAEAVDIAEPRTDIAAEERVVVALSRVGQSDVAWPEEEPDAEPFAAAPVLPRPYVRTNGRTTPGHELRLETVVTATYSEGKRSRTSDLNPDLHRIRQTCRTPSSVAEVAAHLHLPIGAARVLLSDAIDAGLLVAHDAPVRADGRPHLELLHRVHAGLRRLA